MKLLISIALLAMLISACATVDKYLGSTEAWYNPDGTFYYKSNKNQENLKASLGRDPKGNPMASVETTAYTPETAMLKVAELNMKMAEMFGKAMDQLSIAIAPLLKGAAVGAGS